MNVGQRTVVRLADAGTAAQAVRVGSFLYTSGIVSPAESVNKEVENIYATLTEVLKQAGSSWPDVVKVNYYTTPSAKASEVALAMRATHTRHAGSGTCAVLAAPLLATPDGARVRVELIARPGTKRSVVPTVEGVPHAGPWVYAARADETLYISGQLPLPADVRSDDARIPLKGDLGIQTAAAYAHHDRILRAGGMKWSDAIQVHQFLTQRKLAIDDFQRARHRYLTPAQYLSTSVACEPDFPEWSVEGCLILVDMEADSRDHTPVYATDTWGNKPGPQAFWCGGLLRMHGQVPRGLDARTQHPDDIEAQIRLTFENLTGVLRAAGIGWDDVIHIRTFCRESDHSAIVQHMRTEWVAPDNVASTDLVAEFFDPLLLVEIELVAFRQY